MALAMLLAAINQTFSLFDPMIFGKILDKYATHPFTEDLEGKIPRSSHDFMMGVMKLLLLLVGTAMISQKAINVKSTVALRLWVCLGYCDRLV